jgi:hypothetical protein
MNIAISNSRHRRILAAAVLAVGWLAVTGIARADGPGVGPAAVVTLGDSGISGEAGRWAGNTNGAAWRVDALGPAGYHDRPGGETIGSCHRSASAEAFIGDGFETANLSCSGARTYSHFRWDGAFKPGLDFYRDAAGRQGQALALQDYAATHNVRAVVVLIGANDYGFASVMRSCVLGWLGSTRWNPRLCSADAGVRATFSHPRVVAETARIRGALQNVGHAMANAGYSSADYTLLVQTYSSPIPRGSGIRYPETGLTRQSVGGCGLWNRDADWANDWVLPTLNGSVRHAMETSGIPNVALLDMSDALVGRRLCERGVGLLEETGLASWRSLGAVDRTEWVSQVRTVTTAGAYELQEAGHPSYWGQLALRNCLRQAVAGSTPRGGRCVIGGWGLTWRGEPVMVLR